jgi:hypothetical protein
MSAADRETSVLPLIDIALVLVAGIIICCLAILKYMGVW